MTEPKPPFEEKVPEPFPAEPFIGYGKFVKAATRDVRVSTRMLQEAEQRLVSHEHLKWSYKLPRPERTFMEWREAGRPGTFQEFKGKMIPAKEFFQREREQLLAARVEAVRSLSRASWFTDFYATAPNLVEIGAIASLDDYLELMKSDPTGFVSEEDLEVARGVLAQLTGTRKVAPRRDAPEWLQVTPEEEEVAREFLKAEATLPPPIAIHSLTTKALLQSLSMRPKVELPEGMSDTELLAIASVMDIPLEEVTRVVDYTELIEPYSKAISEREEHVKAVLAGEEEWEMPELGFWQRAMFTVLSPMQVAADIIKPHLEKVSYPLAGFSTYIISRTFSLDWAVEEQYAKMKAMDYGWWEAMSEAWMDLGLPWYVKLPIEIVTDPITYIPGLVLSIPGKTLVKIPTTATRALGSGMLRLNRGLWTALDVPFDMGKALWARIPKSFNQATKFQLDQFRDILVAATSKQSGKIPTMFTPDDVTKTLERAMKEYAATPMAKGNTFVDLGAELMEHAPLGVDSIKIWSRSLGGKLDDVTPAIIESVDDVISDSIMKLGSPAENAKRMAIALAIDDTPAIIGKIIKDISVLTTKYSSRVPRAIEIGRIAKVSPVLQMTEYLVSGQKVILAAIERSAYAKGKAMSGIVLALMNKVDKLERGMFRMTLDRWLVRPMAEAYLGSAAYPLWNAFEGIFVSVMEGVVPRQVKQEAFDMMFLDVIGVDPRLRIRSASDVAGFFGSMPGREGSISIFSAIAGKPGPISFLPGKVPEKVLGLRTPKWIAGKDWFEWTGKKPIVLSDIWGTALRQNFLMRKMAHYLAEYSYNVAGHDLNAAFGRLINRQFPKGAVSKKSIGLTDHELKQDMFARVTSGLRSSVLGAKDVYSNSSLMQGEALKILRQATELSPQAKTLGEQMIARGEVLRTTDDVLNFCRVLADQSIADLRAFPTQAPDAFRFMADQMEALAAKKPLAGVSKAVIVDLREGAEYESRFWFGAYTYTRIPKAAKDAPIRKMIPMAREHYNALRRKIGLEPITDWTKRPEQTLENMLREAIKEPEVLGIGTPEDLMQIFQHYEVMADSASRVPMRLLSQVFGEADELKRLGKFRQLEELWRTSRADVDNIVSSINESLSRARAVVQAKSGLLKDKEQIALNTLMERNTARTTLQEQFLHFDGRLLDDFWALPKAMRTGEEHTALRAYRWDNMLKYKGEDAVLGAGDFLERKSYAQLYYDLPTPKMFHVDASARALSANDCAKAMNCNVDALTTGLMESMTFQDKPYFIQMIKQSADAHPQYFKGFTEDKIGQVYDDIVRGLKMSPEADIASQKILQQVEGVKQRMIALRMSHSLSPTEEKALHGWIDDVARGVDDIFGEGIEPVRKYAEKHKQKGMTYYYHATTKENAASVSRGGLGEGNIYLSSTLENVEDFIEQSFAGAPGARGLGAGEKEWVVFRTEHKYGDFPFELRSDVDWGVPGVYVGKGRIQPSELSRVGTYEFGKGKGIVTKAQWDDIRQQASERAHKEYYKAFADYTNENLIDAMGKMIYPFWCTPEYVTALTKSGWKHYSQLRIGEELLTVNPETLVTEWQPIQELAEFDYDDDLMVIPAKGKDIEFTPDHRWLVTRKDGSISRMKRGYELTEQIDMIPRALPHAFPKDSFLLPREAALLGWVVTDGSTSEYQMLIYQSEAKYFDEIVKLAGEDVHLRQDSRDDSNWIIKISKDDFYTLRIALDQYSLPELVTMLSKEAAEAMWDAMFKAEGNIYECYTGSLQRSFKQNPGDVMQAFQLLSVLAGKAITATSHRVNILDNRKPFQSKEVRRLKSKHYKGKIWCPVTANGTWFANFNGCILPTGNTYHLYRWFFLPRTFLRKPGVMAAWGKYYEYSDRGYMHIPGTDLEFSPAVGSAFGATFSLTRHDFKTYYENLGFLGEVLDYTQRRGFYPGIHISLPIALTSIFSGRPPEIGEVLPPLHRVGLNLLIVSEIPGVADAARWLKDKVFHENFHEYYTSTVVSSKQSEAGGKLVEGQSGVDLWFKQLRGERLKPEEQALWDEAYNEAAWYAILRSEFPEFRLRAEDMIEAHEQVTALIEAQTGLDADLQDELWKHNLRPTDVLGGMPLDLQMALDQMWQWRIYFGRGAILMPPEYSNLYSMMDKYYDKVENLQIERLGLQVDTNKGFLQPTAELHFNGREWRREYASNWSNYIHGVETLDADPEFADAIDAMTPEGHARLMKELGFAVPPVDPMREAIRLYFLIEMEKKIDPYTGEEDWDYLRFWLEREAVRMALTEEQRGDFDAYIRRYKTPMEILFKNVSNTYLRGYRAVTRIVLEEFTDEEKALIAEYYADTTTRERQLEIKEFVSHGGRKLISHWDSRRTEARGALREVSPKLDFWLYVFGYTTAPKTDEAKAMIDAWEKDKPSIVLGITETPLLEEVIRKAEERKAEEVK